MTAWWVKEKWISPSDSSEAPSCVRCGRSMYLKDGCEWNEGDNAVLNVCDRCAQALLVEMWDKLRLIPDNE